MSSLCGEGGYEPRPLLPLLLQFAAASHVAACPLCYMARAGEIVEMNHLTLEDYLPFFNWGAADIAMFNCMIQLDHSERWFWDD
jgi:hypothetical protein